MSLTAKLSSWFEFLFQIVFTTVLITQIRSMEPIYNNKSLLIYLIVGVTLLFGILLGINILVQRIPKIIFLLGNLGFFICPLINWMTNPIFIVFFFICMSVAMYPFIMRLSMNFPNKQQSAIINPESMVNLIGIGLGILLSRYLQFVPFNLSVTLSTSILYFGIGVIIISVLHSGIENHFTVLTQADQQFLSLDIHRNLIFLAFFFLFESAFIPTLSFASSVISIEAFFILQLITISIAILLHVFISGAKLYCPILFLGCNLVFAFAQSNSVIMAITQIAYEFIILNMLFIFPQLPRYTTPKSPQMRMKLNLLIWVFAVVILIGGQFIFPHGDDNLQLAALFLGSGLILLLWIKPRFLLKEYTIPQKTVLEVKK